MSMAAENALLQDRLNVAVQTISDLNEINVRQKKILLRAKRYSIEEAKYIDEIKENAPQVISDLGKMVIGLSFAAGTLGATAYGLENQQAIAVGVMTGAVAYVVVKNVDVVSKEVRRVALKCAGFFSRLF